MAPDGRAPAFPAWLAPLVLAGLFAVQLWAFHWGVVTPDGLWQYSQALAGSYDDWHPPVTAWLWRQLMRLHPGGAPFLLFEDALYWTGGLLLIEALRRQGERLAAALAAAALASPIPFGQMGAILKDPLLAACCLAATGLLLFRGTAGRARVACTLAAALLIVLASATRINAVFATAPLLAFCLLPGWMARPALRPIVALALSAAALIVTTHAIDEVALAPHHSRPFLSLVNFDFGGIVAGGGANPYPELTDAEARRLTAACYSAALYNPTDTDDCGGVEDGLAEHIEANQVSLVRLWLHGIAAAPLPYLRHRLAHLNRNWRLLVPDMANDAVYVASTPNEYGLGFVPRPATLAVARAARWTALSPLGRPATWLAVALGLLMLAPWLGGRGSVVPLCLSALAYGGGYGLISVAPDLRYNLWTMLAAMLALSIALTGLWRARAAIPGRRLILAATPAAIAICGELAWLGLGLGAP